MKSTTHKIHSYVGFRSKICDRLNKKLMEIVVYNTTYKSFLQNISVMIRY